MKYHVTVIIDVEANSYEGALDEGESIMIAANHLLYDDVEFQVVTAEEVKEDG